MPQRPLNREQVWVLPPSLQELVPADPPARFVAAFVDALGRREWGELGVAAEGSALGAPSYAPRVLLGVWLYGFMTGVRSSRKLEAACRDQLPYLWLTGWQRPDHTTLWRF
jgi:transposase